jgi:hypothetical protein
VDESETVPASRLAAVGFQPSVAPVPAAVPEFEYDVAQQGSCCLPDIAQERW